MNMPFALRIKAGLAPYVSNYVRTVSIPSIEHRAPTVKPTLEKRKPGHRGKRYPGLVSTEPEPEHLGGLSDAGVYH